MRYHILTGMADAMDATIVERRTQEKHLVLFLFNGKNHQGFNENWQEWVDFYDCGAVFENGYNPLQMMRLKELKQHTGHER